MIESETHPFKLYVPKNSKTLIIGTFPPTKRNWSYDFFYPNKLNLFWPVMSRLADVELKYFKGSEAVEERKQILTSLSVAITDMALEISRKEGNSLDENLIVIQYMDIFKILHKNPAINKIIFTSSSGPASAAKWFLAYLKSKNIIHKFPKGLKPLRSEFRFDERIIQLSILYSPSRRAANRISFEKLVEMYENEIIRRE